MTERARSSRWAGTTRRSRGPSSSGSSPTGVARARPLQADGGDSPAWSRKRGSRTCRRAGSRAPGRPGRAVRRAALPPQLQLPRRRQPPGGAGRGGGPAGPARAGAHRPRRLLRRVAVGRGGARRTTLPTVFGAELSLGLTRPAERRRRPRGQPPAGAGPRGRGLPPAGRGDHRRRSCAATRRAGRSTTSTSSPSAAGGHWMVLTGCRKGAVRQALAPTGGRRRRPRELDRLDRAVRPRPRRRRADRPRPPADTDAQRRPGRAGRRATACRWSRPTTCTTPRPAEHRLAAAMAAVRARRSLAEMDGWLPAAGAAHLRSRRRDGGRASRATPARSSAPSTLADELRLRPAQRPSPRLPKQEVPDGHTPMTLAAGAGRRGADERYADRADEPTRERHRARARGDRGEGLPRLLPDRPRHRRSSPASRGILCQGRGSAANSAVCYAARHHRRRPDPLRPAVRAVPLRAPATRSPTSTSTSTPTGARR